jgi:1-acyl-sn-glycerol-3-phosphate acyltransferase
MDSRERHFFAGPITTAVDLGVTLLLWGYYTVGFVLFFSPFYIKAYLFSENREIAFQRLNHLFYRGFFYLLRILAPRHRWVVAGDLAKIRSCVVVCNHVSYLDPLLLISLFERHKTIAKSSLFKIPIFGSMLRLSGYLPSSPEGSLKELLIHHMETMSDYLAAGGILFIFPEGTRSRDGVIGGLNKGAFKIARLCRVPIKVLFVRNTNALFRPGKFLFNTGISNTVTLDTVETIAPDYDDETISISQLMERVGTILTAQSKFYAR